MNKLPVFVWLLIVFALAWIIRGRFVDNSGWFWS